jgi:uncharacterized membrane protein YkvA (DUF1232 family)
VLFGRDGPYSFIRELFVEGYLPRERDFDVIIMLKANAMFNRLKESSRSLRAELYALYLAYRDPRVPWYAKAFAALVVGYAFSPIDLIPDFIPLRGYLDDLILLPLGILLALRMIPREVMEEARLQAQMAMEEGKPVNWRPAVLVILIWLLLLAFTVSLVVRFLNAR